MVNLKICPNKINGEITLPPSKSVSHRAVISAALADGTSNLKGIAFSDDIKATINAVKMLGAKITYDNQCISITGISHNNPEPIVIDCRESGSTLRFFIPIALLSQRQTTFTGKGNLGSRPLTPYFNIFDKQGIYYSNIGLPLHISGQLSPDTFEIDGSISSQFVTGLLFALPALKGDSRIIITNELESKGYIDITLDVLRKFNIHIENINYKQFNILGNQSYKPADISIESDYSQAAFWLIAGLLGDKIKCKGLCLNSTQGDKVILDIIKKMNGNIIITDDSIITTASDIKGSVIDVSQCPDLAPIIAVLGAVAEGTTKIINAGRLRIKECDRLTAIVTELSKLGADIYEEKDIIIINGKPKLLGGTVWGWGDHRIVMALAIASIKCENPVFIEGCEAVTKSYPDFFNDFAALGGILDERKLG